MHGDQHALRIFARVPVRHQRHAIKADDLDLLTAACLQLLCLAVHLLIQLAVAGQAAHFDLRLRHALGLLAVHGKLNQRMGNGAGRSHQCTDAKSRQSGSQYDLFMFFHQTAPRILIWRAARASRDILFVPSL